MTKIYLIRHCETTANRDGVIQGTKEYDITDEGAAQLEKLKDRFENIHLDRIYTSPLIRTVKTANAVRGERDIELIKEKGFIEFNFGIYQGMPLLQIEKDFPEVYSTFKQEFYKMKAKGGQTYSDFYKTAWDTLQKTISQNKDKTVAIISHGGTIRAIMLKLLFDDMTRLNDVPRVVNTAVFEIDFYEDGTFYVKTANDDSHLNKKAAVRLEI